ncbi:hypothetical protein [Desulfovibrio falkowii]|uniref:Uncharacterized protein n=1 Tax=Desulfovibrio falkowii TaxID=3136602 RepID=A0ABQ0EBH7_9BACT
MAQALSPILTVAKEILQTAGRKGMHTSEIAQAAVAQNKNMGLAPEDFQKKVQAALAANLNQRRPRSRNPFLSPIFRAKMRGPPIRLIPTAHCYGGLRGIGKFES